MMNRLNGAGPLPPDDLPDDLIDLKAAARLLKCDLATVHRWRHQGRFRAWRRVGRWFCSRAEVLGLFRPQQSQPAPVLRPRERTDWSMSEEELRREGF